MIENSSFSVNHLKLLPGVYVSRLDSVGDEFITTFDLRITRPNFEPVMNTAEVHTLEHLCSVYLRNHHQYGDKILYFGPMGCRTGFYMLVKGRYKSEEILPLIVEMFEYVAHFEGDIPGANAKSCGNYSDMNLGMARYWAHRYLQTLEFITEENLKYQQ